MGATAGQIGLQLGSAGATGAATAALTTASIATAAVTAGIGAVAVLVMAFLSRKGPQQKVLTTQVVNQVEPLLKQNLAAWNASSKSCADQAVCLAHFDVLWNEVVQSCADPSLGDPGHSCIDDRLPSGVQFEYNTFHLVGNGKWNWFSYYRDPIANDPAAQGCCPQPACYFPNCTPVSTGCIESTSGQASQVLANVLPAGVTPKMALVLLAGLGFAWWMAS